MKIIHLQFFYKDKYANELCWEEMLGLIASLTISNNKPCQ